MICISVVIFSFLYYASSFFFRIIMALHNVLSSDVLIYSFFFPCWGMAEMHVKTQLTPENSCWSHRLVWVGDLICSNRFPGLSVDDTLCQVCQQLILEVSFRATA